MCVYNAFITRTRFARNGLTDARVEGVFGRNGGERVSSALLAYTHTHTHTHTQIVNVSYNTIRVYGLIIIFVVFVLIVFVGKYVYFLTPRHTFIHKFIRIHMRIE